MLARQRLLAKQEKTSHLHKMGTPGLEPADLQPATPITELRAHVYYLTLKLGQSSFSPFRVYRHCSKPQGIVAAFARSASGQKLIHGGHTRI